MKFIQKIRSFDFNKEEFNLFYRENKENVPGKFLLFAIAYVKTNHVCPKTHITVY